MDDLETQAQQELDAMIAGTNATEEDTTDTEEETTDDVDTETETDVEEWENQEEEEETEEEQPKTKKEKTEDRFKKILSQKNDLTTRVAELENTLADKDFYSQKPQATKFKDEIGSIMENNPNLSRDDAFNMIAGRENLSAKPKGLLGKPKTPEAKKSVKDMTSKELETYAKENNILEGLMNK